MDYEDLMKLDVPVAAAIISYAGAWELKSTNSEFERLSGRTAETDGEFVFEKDRAAFGEMLGRTASGEDAGKREIRLMTGSNETRWTEASCRLIGKEDESEDILVMFWDIDESKKIEMEQQLQSEKYETMEQLSQEFPFDVDVENGVMLRSYRLMELCGIYGEKDRYYPIEDEILTLHPDDREPFDKAISEASHMIRSDSIDTRFCVSTDGDEPKYIWLRTFYRSVTDGDGRIIRIIGRSFNIDTDKQLQEKVRLDPLTKILNKVEVQREVAAFLADNSSGTHAMFIVDIDDFKKINDTFGHTFGDTVITDVAAIIRAQFRKNDIVGRVGGDEFLIFMRDSSREKAVEKAGALCRALEKDYKGGTASGHISASVGLAISGVDGNTFGTLFEKADNAMYRAKQAGKNRFVLANEDDTGLVEKGESKNIEHRGEMSREDKEFLTFATGLLAHARNLDVSMNMLLKRTAEKYDIDLIMLFECDEEKNELVMTNYAGGDYSFYDRSTLTLTSQMLKDMEPGTYKVIRDTEFPERRKQVTLLKTVQELDAGTPYSGLVTKFEFIGEHTGYIFFISLDSGRVWQPNETDLLMELTRMIAIFVSLRFRMDESERQIKRMQHRDALTDLYNVEAFKRRVKMLLLNADPSKIYALEYMDFNNFGYINDNYGYQAGDGILKMMTEDIVTQPYFVVGCRLYSDFFLFLFSDTDAETLEQNLKLRNHRFLNMINHQYPASSIGVTAGIYVLGDTKLEEVDVAIENANLAWKYAKNNGIRDIVFFKPEFRELRTEEQQVVGEFFEALYRDDFQVYLQPKFILGDRTIYGAEALARWKRPDGKVLPPAAFVDSLERIGYITELDFYIFEELLRTLDKWNKQNKRNIVVSTNFSGRHFQGDGEDFLARVTHIMSKYNVSPSCIEIEVTEGVLIQNIGVLQMCVDRLHQMGFRVAIDDFGSGYSSLSVLADIPADVVKIDKSFINKDMTEQKLALLCEIGRMVRILEKDIIIEGIETAEQEQYLKESGFTCGQGYLCNRPIPAGEFEKLYL
ncbi:MAG: diguanylate cyclase [Clostridiales bacterium]|nr:diguanylate cyclase [Clostridiales bacterium]